MEAFINKQKRKKRRTRKSLDKIRKKARQTFSDNGLNKSGNLKIGNNHKDLTSKASISITNDRLTLLKKTVRSETVSRSLISDTKNITYTKDYKKYKANVVNKLILPLKEKLMNQFPNNYSEGYPIIHNAKKEAHYDNAVEISNHKTPSTIILFSPSQKTESLDSSDKYPTDQESLDSLSSVNNSYCENFYDNFMNEIPKYLKQTAPDFLKTDIVHKYKISIRNLFLENEHLKVEDSVHLKEDESNDCSDYECMQNSIDYTGYSYQQASNSVSNSQDSVESQSNNEESISPLYSIVSNSPEYTYYPHKLK